jgi:Peptidase A4 family
MNLAGRGIVAAASGVIMFGLASPAGVARTGAGNDVVQIVHIAGGAAGTNTSDNWSGYNIGIGYPGIRVGTTFTSISAEWTVPTATQHTSGQAENSATWIGIGGGCITDNCLVTDPTLIQAGIEQDVSASGQASYDAWYELVPVPETEVSLPVNPGDQIKVSISETKIPEDWSIVIDDLTTGQSYSKTTVYPSTMTTAEWIEETPLEIGTSGVGLAAMPNLGTVQFSQATLNGANPNFQAIDEMQLVSSGGSVIATPSAPGADLASFNDCVWSTSCVAP